MLEPRHLDVAGNSLHIERKVDKGRRKRRQIIPAALVERLAVFIEEGAANEQYARAYENQGKRLGGKKTPKDPLLYVPFNSATMLKKDLEAAGIPFATEDGRLDFHALRTAYINFLLDLGAGIKTTQELARHATVETTLNFFGKAKREESRVWLKLRGDAAQSASFPQQYNINKQRML